MQTLHLTFFFQKQTNANQKKMRQNAQTKAEKNKIKIKNIKKFFFGLTLIFSLKR